MNYEEWALLWDELGFTRELTERKIGTAFAQSRMTVIDEHSKSGKSVQLERLRRRLGRRRRRSGRRLRLRALGRDAFWLPARHHRRRDGGRLLVWRTALCARVTSPRLLGEISSVLPSVLLVSID